MVVANGVFDLKKNINETWNFGGKNVPNKINSTVVFSTFIILNGFI